MWPLPFGGQPDTVAMHDAPIKEVAWIPEMNLLANRKRGEDVEVRIFTSFYMNLKLQSMWHFGWGSKLFLLLEVHLLEIFIV